MEMKNGMDVCNECKYNAMRKELQKHSWQTQQLHEERMKATENAWCSDECQTSLNTILGLRYYNRHVNT